MTLTELSAESFVFVVLMEDELVHTDESPLCSDLTCPCQGDTLAAIETSCDPDRDAFIRVFIPGETGVRVLPSRNIQDYDDAVEIVKAHYPAARIIGAGELDETVFQRSSSAHLLNSDDFIPEYPCLPQETTWYEC